MRGVMVSVAALLVASVCYRAAYPGMFFGEGPPGEPVIAQDGWPAGLAELLTRGGRVYSCSMGWLGGDEDSFYFSGDADDFNWFVEQYAKLKEVSRTLVLHPGRGEANRIMDQQPVGPFDWKVSATAHWAKSKRNLDISLDLWVGGQVTLEKLKVPLDMEARAAGQGEQFKEMEKFIADHEAKN